MEQKRKLSDIANQITPLEEDQQGKLSGGFAAIGSSSASATPGEGNNVNVNVVSSCSCTCNTVSGCGTVQPPEA